MLCSVCGDPLYPGEGVYSFEDPNDDEKEYIFCSLECLEEYFGIEEWCVGQMTEKITKSWIEKAIHQKAVDRFEKEIIKTGLSLSRSILKITIILELRKLLNMKKKRRTGFCRVQMD